jgi:hypothetical protein
VEQNADKRIPACSLSPTEAAGVAPLAKHNENKTLFFSKRSGGRMKPAHPGLLPDLARRQILKGAQGLSRPPPIVEHQNGVGVSRSGGGGKAGEVGRVGGTVHFGRRVAAVKEPALDLGAPSGARKRTVRVTNSALILSQHQ